MGKKIKLGFVRGPYSPYSIGRELELFQARENLDVISITPDRLPNNTRQYRKVRIKKIFPEMGGLWFKMPVVRYMEAYVQQTTA